jgi:Ca2+-binding EF-hand superfamily protein
VKKILIALALICPTAFAQQGQMPQMPDLGEMFFKQFDSNQDGRVDKDEFLKPTEAQFDHMDKDGNGALDRAEVKAFNDEMQQRMEEMQRQMQQQYPQGMPRR